MCLDAIETNEMHIDAAFQLEKSEFGKILHK